MKRVVILLVVALAVVLTGLSGLAEGWTRALLGLGALLFMFAAVDLLRWLADGDPPEER